MSDLVEAIRAFLDNPRASPGSLVFRSGKTLKPEILAEAADELTSLRARVLVLEGAMRDISNGTTDRKPPFRAMGGYEMAVFARSVLQGLSQDQGREGYGVSVAESGGTTLSKSDGPISDGWQPISTAPKDGTRILLWIVHEPCDFSPDHFERPSIGYWLKANTNLGWERDAGWEREWIGEPTHWRELPSAPVEAGPAK